MEPWARPVASPPGQKFAHDAAEMLVADVERVKGIEPLYAAWEAAVLPLNYTRVALLRRSR
jgi:hypothetical protein